MQLYLFQNYYPLNSTPEWYEDIKGISHDDYYWFIAQKGNIWKFPVSHDLNKPTGSDGQVWKFESTYQLGDLDYYGQYLFVPVIGSGTLDERIMSDSVLKTKEQREKDRELRNCPFPKIFIFRVGTMNSGTSCLRYVRCVRLRDDCGDFVTPLYWVAINPKTGLLYTSGKDIDKDHPIRVYTIGSVSDEQPLKFHSKLYLYDEYSSLITSNNIRGGCFDNQNHLHLNMRGISVFALNISIHQNTTNMAYRLGTSDDELSEKTPFWINIKGQGTKIAGLTYWDLSNNSKVSSEKFKNHFHGLVSYIDGFNEQQLTFFNYFQTHSTFYQVTLLFGSRDGAGTRSDIVFKLKGANSAGAEHTLSASKFSFAPGGAYMYTFEEKENLGELKGLDICPRNEGKDAEFFLNMAIITRFGADPKSWTFQCNKWVGHCPANQGSDDSSPKKDLFPRIRYLSLKNSGGFALKLHVYTGPDQLHMSSKDIELVGSYPLGKTKTADLTKFADKIKDGYVVRLNASVVWGKDNPAKEYFIVDKTSNKKACYVITGATRNNTLHYKGLENYS